MNGEASTTVQIDGDGIRVVRYDMGPGERIPWHRHEHDYLVVPLTDGVVQVAAADGASTLGVHAGEPYRRSAGAEHELVNGADPYSFIEIEFIPRGAQHG
jgi:quercetin dioxygenase-like cupin family protein